MPWKVLLAMSMMPPVGLATAPTRPLPTPLKKPAAPSFWAPARHDGSVRGQLERLLSTWLEQQRTFDGFGDDAGDPTDEALRGQETSRVSRVYLPHIHPESTRTSGVTRVRTDTSPFPPRASPSFRPLGCLFMASLLFCWYSSSMVMAATPFAMAPVILEAAPARPPGGWRFRTCQYATDYAAAATAQHGGQTMFWMEVFTRVSEMFEINDNERISQNPFFTFLDLVLVKLTYGSAH